MRKLLACISLLLAVSCSSSTSYNEQILPAYEAYRDGDVAAAADISSAIYSEHYDSNSRVVFALDNGTMLRDAGHFQQAFDVLEQAEATLKIGYDQRSAMNATAVGEAAASVLINQKSLAYTGTIYDRVLLNTYKALAQLELGQLDYALVEARRIDQAQQLAEKLFREDYEALKSSSTESGYDVDVDKLYKHEGFVKQYRNLFKDSGVDDFQNPFSTFVIGLLRRISPNNGEDPTYDFNWLHERLPNNIYIEQELAAIKGRQSADGTIYVIFENGRGPSLAEELIVIPTGVFKYYSGSSYRCYDDDYLALPKFVPGRKSANALEVVSGAANRATTMMIADMNQIALHEFQARFPSILKREIVSAAVKGVAFNVLQSASEELVDSDDGGEIAAGIILGIGGILAERAIAQADDRSWKSIACNYQIARLDRKDVKSVQLKLIGGNASSTVELPDKSIVVIIVRSVNSSHLNARVYGFGNPTMK